MIAKINSTNCNLCTSESDCNLSQISGISCDQIKKVGRNGLSILVIDNNCRSKILNLKQIVSTAILNGKLKLNIGEDVNGYDSTEKSLSYNEETGELQFDQEIVKRKFNREVLFRIVYDPRNNSNISYQILSKQNVMNNVSLIITPKTIQDPNPNIPAIYTYLEIELVGIDFEKNETMIILSSPIYVFNNLINTFSNIPDRIIKLKSCKINDLKWEIAPTTVVLKYDLTLPYQAMQIFKPFELNTFTYPNGAVDVLYSLTEIQTIEIYARFVQAY